MHKQIMTKTTSVAAHLGVQQEPQTSYALRPSRAGRCTHTSILVGLDKRHPFPWFLLCGMNWWPSQGFQPISLCNTQQHDLFLTVCSEHTGGDCSKEAQNPAQAPSLPHPLPSLSLGLLAFAVYIDAFQQVRPLNPLVATQPKVPSLLTPQLCVAQMADCLPKTSPFSLLKES